jgi:hypothetical protein
MRPLRFLLVASVLWGCSHGANGDGSRDGGHAAAGAPGQGPCGAASAAGSLPITAGAGGGGGQAGDDALIVPAGLGVTGLESGHGVLDVIALTLRVGASNLELYAALRNVGDTPACDAAFSVELFDQQQYSLTAGIGGLYTNHLYRLTDGTGTIAACVGPGDVTMAAITDLPSIALDTVGSVTYRCSYFAIDVSPIDGLNLGPVASVAESGATAYTGTVVNGLDVPVSNPSVTVFPVNRVGRPLGVASARGSNDIPPTTSIPPCGRWTFRTNAVTTSSTGAVAFPAGSVAHDVPP